MNSIDKSLIIFFVGLYGGVCLEKKLMQTREKRNRIKEEYETKNFISSYTDYAKNSDDSNNKSPYAFLKNSVDKMKEEL
jgi:hypothetical protein